jgi:hypothetical protein
LQKKHLNAFEAREMVEKQLDEQEQKERDERIEPSPLFAPVRKPPPPAKPKPAIFLARKQEVNKPLVAKNNHTQDDDEVNFPGIF